MKVWGRAAGARQATFRYLQGCHQVGLRHGEAPLEGTHSWGQLVGTQVLDQADPRLEPDPITYCPCDLGHVMQAQGSEDDGGVSPCGTQGLREHKPSYFRWLLAT